VVAVAAVATRLLLFARPVMVLLLLLLLLLLLHVCRSLSASKRGCESYLQLRFLKMPFGRIRTCHARTSAHERRRYC
jgi:hypothetical protein